MSSYGSVRLDNGQTTDFTGLNWSHIPKFPFVNSRDSLVEDDPAGEYEWSINIRDINDNGWDLRIPFTVVDGPSGILGDLNHDGLLEIGDVDLLTRNISVGATNLRLDMNGDEAVSSDDLTSWVTQLKQTWIGDTNLDGEFNVNDLLNLLQANKFSTGQSALWSEGDWNGDELFNTDDLLLALADNGFNRGPHPMDLMAQESLTTVSPVPEPASLGLLITGIVLIGIYGRKRLR